MIILWTFLYWGCEEWECVAMLFYTCSQSYLKMEEIDTSSVSTDSASNVKHNPEKEAAATDWGREVGTRCEQLSSTTGAPFCRQCGQSSRILAASWGPWLPGMFSGWSQRSLITSVCSLGWRQVDVPKPSRESGKTWKTATFHWPVESLQSLSSSPWHTGHFLLSLKSFFSIISSYSFCPALSFELCWVMLPCLAKPLYWWLHPSHWVKLVDHVAYEETLHRLHSACGFSLCFTFITIFVRCDFYLRHCLPS